MPTNIEKNINVTNYMPFIISDKWHSLNLNDQGLLSKIENADDQYTFIHDPEYLELIKQNEMEIAGVKFKITDSVWSFSSKMPDTVQNTADYSYIFDELERCSDYYKVLVKLFVLNNLIHFGIHRKMVKADFLNIRRLIIYVYTQHIYSLSDISIKTISDFLVQTDITESSKQAIKKSITKFLIFYYQITGNPIDESLLDYLHASNIQILNAERINGKLDLLPQEFMDSLIKLLMKTLYATSEKMDHRIKAGLLLISTQTGLRPNELTIIPYDCIEYKSINGIPYTELHYNTTKGVFGAGYEVVHTFANETTINAVNTIKELKNSKYLGNVKYIQLYNFFRHFIIENAAELGCVSRDEPLEEFNGAPLIKKIDEGTLFINIPKIKQFRVYLASELNRRGYNEFAIASLLSHKDEKMLGYYARPIAKSEEDKIYRDMFLRDVIEDDLKIIGPKGDEYTARIKAYLEKNKKIDVRSNLREIGNDIDGLMPMKVIPGGFCICPAPKMSCEATNKDNADSIYCAYGLCSNQSHLYYDMPFHMDQFHNCIDSVQYNIENQYEQEAEKELYKAQFICKTLLLPELNELKELIERKGSDYIIQKHPEMETIINDMSNIEKEILKWEKITIEKVKQLQKKKKSKK